MDWASIIYLGITFGLFVIFGVFDGFGNVAATVRESARYQALFSPWQLPQGFGIHLILAMAAILCLPRQFHVAIVEFRDRRELALARWLFPAYLAVFAVLIMPIALAGLALYHPGLRRLRLPLLGFLLGHFVGFFYGELFFHAFSHFSQGGRLRFLDG